MQLLLAATVCLLLLAIQVSAKAAKAPQFNLYGVGSSVYTTPTNPKPLYLRIRLQGAGGGGSAPGAEYCSECLEDGRAAGQAGNVSTFGPSSNPTQFSVYGGGGGLTGTSGGAGGNIVRGAYTGYYLGFNGSPGDGGEYVDTPAGDLSIDGGAGGVPYFGGGSVSSFYDQDNPTVYGGGGAGGCASATTGETSTVSGSGGGSGAYVEITLTAPLAASYDIKVGAGGAGGRNTITNDCNGSPGSSGLGIIEAYFQ
jgi:hypothetical protein